MAERETLDVDVLFVGAGPAGLGGAIRLAQLAKEAGRTLSICVIEKANEVAYKWDKDYPLNFYSRELLFSDEARAKFVEPDLEPDYRK